jgi:molybdopterin-containing oxidoreductase family iron-sulfur binding subunit
MEKCTFCVQRIRKTADEFKDQGKKVPDGALKTACQQSCPADAIVFGDLNDANSEVSKLSELAQSFKVLEVLNTKPSISYLPRIRNKGTA